MKNVVRPLTPAMSPVYTCVDTIVAMATGFWDARRLIPRSVWGTACWLDPVKCQMTRQAAHERSHRGVDARPNASK